MLGSVISIRLRADIIKRPLRNPVTLIRGVATRKHIVLPTQAAGVSNEPLFPSWKQRNLQLKRDIKDLLGGDTDAINQLKISAAALRAGEASTYAFLREFRDLCGHSKESDRILDSLTSLLPTSSLQAALEHATASTNRLAQPGQAQLADARMHARDTRVESFKPSQTASTASTNADRQQYNTDRQLHIISESSAMPSSAAASSTAVRQQPKADRQQQVVSDDSAVPTATPSAAEGGCGSGCASGVAVGTSDRQPAFEDGAELPPQGEQRSAKRQRGQGASSGGSTGVVVWLRQDLRLHDNPTLTAAALHARRSRAQLTFLFIDSPIEDGDTPPHGASWRPGAASRLWQHHALATLDADLQRYYGPGAAIIYRHGPFADAVAAVAKAADASDVFFTERYETSQQAADVSLVATLERNSGLTFHIRQAFLLNPPDEIRVDMSKWTGHFGTLTPFDRACSRMKKSGKPLPRPLPRDVPVAKEHAFAEVCSKASTCQLADLKLAVMPVGADGSVVDWGAGVMAAWRVSEADALAALEQFLEAGFQSYEASRQFADARAVSRLSPYLHFGQLSPRRVLYDAARRGGATVSKTFMRRLVWRDLAYWQLHHWPTMATEPIRHYHTQQYWRRDKKMLRAWQRGRTGFPLVDAGMRQLYQTGWMQQSLRMVVACFLTEYLNMWWVEGAAWFHDTLVDADLAINSMMWQNAGKAGLDQWNFTLLPTSKAQDPTGDFTRTWVPELAKLPTKYLLSPWDAPPQVLRAAGVELGATYPHRIIDTDLQKLKGANRAAIMEARNGGPPSDSAGYDLIRVPKGATKSHDGQMMRVYTVKPLRAVTKERH